jgi:MFS transporter, DHA1 family, tetracycline resistance protein
MDKKPFLVIFLTVFMDLVGFGIVIPLNPYLARRFGADPLQVGLLLTVFSLLQFLCAPFWGRLSDRLGRRPIILISVLGSAVSHLWFGMAGTLVGLFMARGLAGLFGGNISAAMAAMADLTPANQRSKGMGLIGAAFGLGFIFGPFIGGISADVGYRWGDAPPFGGSFPALIAAAICFANFALAFFILPETLSAEKRAAAVARAAGGAGVSGVASGSSGTGMTGARPHRIGKLLGALRRPVLGPVMWIFFLASLAMAHMEASLFLLVQDRFNWNLVSASLGFAYVGVMIAFTQGYLIRKTLPKWGEAKSFLTGLVLMGAGFAGIALAGEIWQMAVAVTLLALGNGFSMPALTGSVSLLSPEESQGGHLGVNQSLSALGRIIGPASGGWFYKQFGMGVPFLVAAGLVFAGAMIGWGIKGKMPRGAKT